MEEREGETYRGEGTKTERGRTARGEEEGVKEEKNTINERGAVQNKKKGRLNFFADPNLNPLVMFC